MKKSFLKVLYKISIFIILGGIWQGFCFFSDDLAGILPAPSAVFSALFKLALDGTLLKYSVASLFRVTVGFYLALLFALPMGLLLGQWPAANRIFNGLIQFLRPISPLAWIPLAMVWFGIGDPPAIFLIFLSTFFPLLIPTISAVQQIHPRYFQIASNFNFSRWHRVKFILIPAVAPEIVTAMRVAVGVGWLVVVAAEMIAVKSGLGYLIIDARNALRMEQVVAAMVMIGLIGMVLDALIVKMKSIKSLEWKIVRK